MAQIEIIGEREMERGWQFDAQVLDDAGDLRTHMVALSWADYNHWSPDGTATPEGVAAAVVQFMASRMSPQNIKPTFDASIARRLFPEADEVIPTLVNLRP